jgi:hypothetical protein
VADPQSGAAVVVVEIIEQYAAFIKIECFGLLALSININNSGNIRNYHRYRIINIYKNNFGQDYLNFESMID